MNTKIKVEKLTDVELLHKANSFTTGKDSKMSLATAYRHQHSPIRTQLFWIECIGIPLFVASQLVRSHVGVQYFQRSKRTDRGGEDFNNVCLNLAFRVRTEHVCHENEPIGEHVANYLRFADEIDRLPERFDRYAPTDLAFICNAEALINMAHKRLCAKASKETRDIVALLAAEVGKVDADLAKHLVPQCMYRGGICPEPKGCGYNRTELFAKGLEQYKKLFI